MAMTSSSAISITCSCCRPCKSRWRASGSIAWRRNTRGLSLLWERPATLSLPFRTRCPPCPSSSAPLSAAREALLRPAITETPRRTLGVASGWWSPQPNYSPISWTSSPNPFRAPKTRVGTMGCVLLRLPANSLFRGAWRRVTTVDVLLRLLGSKRWCHAIDCSTPSFHSTNSPSNLCSLCYHALAGHASCEALFWNPACP